MSPSNFFAVSAIATMGMALLSGGANAQRTAPAELCRPGAVVGCTIFGKPGTKKCLGDGDRRRTAAGELGRQEELRFSLEVIPTTLGWGRPWDDEWQSDSL